MIAKNGKFADLMTQAAQLVAKALTFDLVS
jgi:hypothetical protein